ncbi:MAG: hypothetical protein WD875_12085 [Pirellulales bacterium]
MHGATTIGPSVWLVGDFEHPDFAKAVPLVRATADVGPALPEVIVVAQSRPGVIRRREIERLRRSAPLAGVVSLLGSWCEGETRTGRPAAGVRRLYWHEFPSWWQRQMVLRAAGRCPDWARGEDRRLMIDDCRFEERNNRFAIETNCWDTAAALADVLNSVGSETIWLRPGRKDVDLCGVTAGIWEGGQLSDAESERLAAFSARLATQNAPVVALLDFPRRDRCEVARRAGAAAVLGKPWVNVDLMATLRQIIGQAKHSRIAPSPWAA